MQLLIKSVFVDRDNANYYSNKVNLADLIAACAGKDEEDVREWLSEVASGYGTYIDHAGDIDGAIADLKNGIAVEGWCEEVVMAIVPLMRIDGETYEQMEARTKTEANNILYKLQNPLDDT